MIQMSFFENDFSFSLKEQYTMTEAPVAKPSDAEQKKMADDYLKAKAKAEAARVAAEEAIKAEQEKLKLIEDSFAEQEKTFKEGKIASMKEDIAQFKIMPGDLFSDYMIKQAAAPKRAPKAQKAPKAPAVAKVKTVKPLPNAAAKKPAAKKKTPVKKPRKTAA